MGGDPSIDPWVALNELNESLEESHYPQRMNTGYGGLDSTRTYVSLNNNTSIRFLKTYFDGTDILSEFVNPFKADAPIFGTDAFQFKPFLTEQDSISVFIDNLYRVGQLDFSHKASKYGFDLFNYKMSYTVLADHKEYPPN